MLIVHHIQIDDLEKETAYAIAGPPNPDRAKLAARLIAEGRYERVAQIDLRATAHGLETAYTLTQNIDGPGWSREPPMGLEPLEPAIFTDHAACRVYGRRSTMIGDVIEYLGKDGPPQRFVVDWVGFTQITTEG
jgi:hypothetical protein